MTEQSAPLGEDGTIILLTSSCIRPCALRCRRPLSSAPAQARARPTFLTDKDRKGHRGLHDTGEWTKLVECKRTVSSKLDSGTEIELSIAASPAYTPLRTRPGRDFLERERR